MRNGSHAVRYLALPRIAHFAFVFLLLTACYLLLAVHSVFAAEFTALPAIIDVKGKAREILHQTIVVENKTDRLIEVYPWVADLDAATGATSETDLGGGSPNERRATSISRWIEVTRGVVSLLPSERREIPVLLQIDLGARPGIYHGAIRFSAGPNRVEAEKNVAGTAEVLINIEVLEEKNIRLQLSSFSASKNLFTGDSASFDLSVENIGNRDTAPSGKIRIYDRGGAEVATVDVNEEGKSIRPSQKELLATSWAADGRFGRYKAMLDVSYGDRGTLQDTVFFWILPWQKVAGLFVTLTILCVVAAVLLHSRSMAGRISLGAKHPHYAFSSIMPSRVRGVMRGDVYDKDEPEYEPVEVDIPPPQSTRWGYGARHDDRTPPEKKISKRARDITGEDTARTDMPMSRERHRAVIDEHKVHLSHKPKPAVDPAHIVSLRRK